MQNEIRNQINRANARHSTGPRTEQGKKRSSLNGMRHGLTGQIHITTDAERVAFENFTKGIVDSLNPSDPLESQLAQNIAEDYWRLNRGRAIENNILALGCLGEDGDFITEHDQNHTALAAAQTFMNNQNAFRLISLYAQRTNRDIQKNITLLKQLQAENEARRKTELEEAASLMQQRLAEGLPYDDLADRHSGIKGNGFVFSLHQIAAYSDRQNRLKGLPPSRKLTFKRAA